MMGCRKNQLTPREREVAGLLAQSKPQREIARELVISRRTAYVHVRRVCEKVGVKTVMEAVVVLAREQERAG
ncbi:MAG: helix-turn-helix transcriptional regulator [Chloroflexi bacterium]|nr:MAG: helix-turn-helix transcriptional regulator [Chloroflexota bacterium]